MRARGEQELHDAGHARGRRRAERSDVVRHLAPPRGFEALRPAGLLHNVLQPGLTQEAHRDAGTRLPRQRRSERQQHAGAVTRDAVRRPRATVGHSSEPGETAVQQLARRTTTDVRNEADATGIALLRRVVQEVPVVRGVSCGAVQAAFPVSRID